MGGREGIDVDVFIGVFVWLREHGCNGGAYGGEVRGVELIGALIVQDCAFLSEVEGEVAGF